MRGSRYIDGVFDGSGDSPRIYLVAENLDAARVKKVILHEAVGHQGMRQIFGDSFNDFLRQIGSEHSAEIQSVAKRRNLDTSIEAKYLEAVEEFLAEKASLGVENGTTWQKICAAFRQFLRNMGLNIAYSDNDIQQLFRQSLRAVQNKTGGSVGNFGSNGASQMANIEQVNIKFNEDIDRQISGNLPNGYIHQLGTPGNILLSTGIPNLPIELSASHLNKKANQKNHPFNIADIKNLPEALQKPIAIFEYGDKSKAQNIIVEIEKDGKNFLVGLSLNSDYRGIAINDIRGLFPKETANWLNWIQEGKALYLNKEKVQKLITQQRTNLAEVSNLDLNSINNIIENFKNPSLENEKNQEKMRFSISPVWTGSAADYDKPSLHAVGTGEGSQVYGWGLYGSESREVAEWYAKRDVERKSDLPYLIIDGEILVEDSAPTEEWKNSLIIFAFHQKAKSKAEIIDEINENIAITKAKLNENISEDENIILQNILNNFETAKEKISKPENDFILPDTKGKRNLYRQTFWGDKEENLLDWDNDITDVQYNKIMSQLASELQTPDAAQQRIIEHLVKNKDLGFGGQSIYKDLSDILGSPKAASEFLYRAGIDGITYIGGSSGVRNYIAFSDEDIRIDEHFRFSENQRIDDQKMNAWAQMLKKVVNPTFNDFQYCEEFLLKNGINYIPARDARTLNASLVMAKDAVRERNKRFAKLNEQRFMRKKDQFYNVLSTAYAKTSLSTQVKSLTVRPSPALGWINTKPKKAELPLSKLPMPLTFSPKNSVKKFRPIWSWNTSLISKKMHCSLNTKPPKKRIYA